MATFSVNNSNNRFTLRLTVTEGNINVAANTSSLTYQLDIIANTGYHFTQFAIGYRVALNGVTVANQSRSAGVQYSIVGGGTLTLCSGMLNGIAHDNDGSHTAPVEYSIDMAAADYAPGPLSGSGSMTLTKIARLSTLSADNGTLGVAQVLTVKKQADDYTHTITYACGDEVGTICTKSVSTSIPWTPPISLASQNATGKTVSIVFTLQTFYGEDSLGSNALLISAAIPVSAGPSCSVSLADNAGLLAVYGAYVQTKSILQITTTAEGKYGSTIKGYSVSADGKVIAGNPVVINPITGSGSMIVQVTVTDSRGYTAVARQSIIVLPYSAPTIPGMSLIRCLADGTADDEGAYCKVSFSGAVATLDNQNSAVYTLQYKQSAADNYTTIILSEYTGQYTPSGSYIFAAAVNSIYDVRMNGTDNFGDGPARALTLPVAFVLMDYHKSGRGLAVGKVATQSECFDCALEVLLDHPLGLLYGGTGATTEEEARNNLGLKSLAAKDQASLESDVSGTLPLANGGTGADNAAGARKNLGLGELAALSIAPLANGGTGADNAAGARSNLGLVGVTLWSGSASSGTLTFSNTGTYTAYVVIGSIRNSSAWTSVVIAGNLISTSTSRFCQLDNDSSYYINFNIYSNKLVINASTGGSTIKYVSGLR